MFFFLGQKFWLMENIGMITTSSINNGNMHDGTVWIIHKSCIWTINNAWGCSLSDVLHWPEFLTSGSGLVVDRVPNKMPGKPFWVHKKACPRHLVWITWFWITNAEQKHDMIWSWITHKTDTVLVLYCHPNYHIMNLLYSTLLLLYSALLLYSVLISQYSSRLAGLRYFCHIEYDRV